MARPTITRGIAELRGRRPLEAVATGRIRRAGAGRPKIEARDPGLLQELRRLLEETTAGDPMSVVRWTTRSTRSLAEALRRRGYVVTWRTVARLLHDLRYSLQANVKTLEGPLLFYKAAAARRWVCAVAKQTNGHGFLVTASPTDAIKEGIRAWPK